MNVGEAVQLRTTDVTATWEWGRTLGAAIGCQGIRELVVALNGDLGAGKTALTQGIAAGLGIRARVTSPTFVFVNEYSTPDRTLVHIDSYRLGEATAAATAEAFTLGLEEILEQAETIIVIEWAERVAALLPADHLAITLTAVAGEPDVRSIRCMAGGETSARLLAAITQ